MRHWLRSPIISAVLSLAVGSAAASPGPGEQRGLTVEAGLGVGVIREGYDDRPGDRHLGLAGLQLGVGGWLADRLALTGRVSGSVLFPRSDTALISCYIGPALQLWLGDHLWIGGGLGLAARGLHIWHQEQHRLAGNDQSLGLGADLRIGYAVTTRSRHVLQASIELVSAAYGDVSYDETSYIHAFGFVIGYQRR